MWRDYIAFALGIRAFAKIRNGEPDPANGGHGRADEFARAPLAASAVERQLVNPVKTSPQQKEVLR
jgi:hypothetical protein